MLIVPAEGNLSGVPNYLGDQQVEASTRRKSGPIVLTIKRKMIARWTCSLYRTQPSRAQRTECN